MKKVGDGENTLFMINKKGSFEFSDSANFEILNSNFTKNYEFDMNTLYSEEYIIEIKSKIQSIKEQIKQKEIEYSEFIEEQKNYDKLDNTTMVEKMLEIEELKKHMFELSSEVQL